MATVQNYQQQSRRFISVDSNGDLLFGFKDVEGSFYYKDSERTILHREKGPAVELKNGKSRWYLNGTPYTEQQHKEKTTNVHH